MKKEEKYTYKIITKQGIEVYLNATNPYTLYKIFTYMCDCMNYDEFIDRYAIVEIHSIKQFDDYGNFETETINKRVLPPVEYLTKR